MAWLQKLCSVLTETKPVSVTAGFTWHSISSYTCVYPSANAMTARKNSLNINDLIHPLGGVVL